MSRRKRKYSTEILKNDNVKTIGITLNEYLTNYSQDRSLDTVFTNWFMKQDKNNPRKQIAEWNELIQKFLNETV